MGLWVYGFVGLWVYGMTGWFLGNEGIRYPLSAYIYPLAVLQGTSFPHSLLRTSGFMGFGVECGPSNRGYENSRLEGFDFGWAGECSIWNLVAGFISPQKVHAFSSIGDSSIPKNL